MLDKHHIIRVGYLSTKLRSFEVRVLLLEKSFLCDSGVATVLVSAKSVEQAKQYALDYCSGGEIQWIRPICPLGKKGPGGL